MLLHEKNILFSDNFAFDIPDGIECLSSHIMNMQDFMVLELNESLCNCVLYVTTENFVKIVNSENELYQYCTTNNVGVKSICGVNVEHMRSFQLGGVWIVEIRDAALLRELNEKGYLFCIKGHIDKKKQYEFEKPNISNAVVDNYLQSTRSKNTGRLFLFNVVLAVTNILLLTILIF